MCKLGRGTRKLATWNEHLKKWQKKWKTGKKRKNKKEDDKSSEKMEENSRMIDNHQPPTYEVGS